MCLVLSGITRAVLSSKVFADSGSVQESEEYSPLILIPFARARRTRISERAENAVPSAGAILGRSVLSPQKAAVGFRRKAPLPGPSARGGCAAILQPNSPQSQSMCSNQLAVRVVASTGTEAAAAAPAGSVVGRDEGFAFVERQTGRAALLVDRSSRPARVIVCRRFDLLLSSKGDTF